MWQSGDIINAVVTDVDAFVGVIITVTAASLDSATNVTCDYNGYNGNNCAF